MCRHLHLFVGILFCTSTIFSQNQSLIDSLQLLIHHEEIDSSIVSLYYQIGEAHNNNPDSSLTYITKGFELSKKSNLTNKEFIGLNLLASHWFFRGNADSALFYVKPALDFDSENSFEKTKSHLTLGKIQFMEGKHEEASKAHLKALGMAEKNKDSVNLIIATTSLGNVYRYLGINDKALLNYQRSLRISKLLQLKNYVASNLGNLGLLYRAQNEHEKALKAYSESLKIHQEMEQDFHVAIDLMNMGVLYESLEQFDKAKKSHLESNTISKKIKDDIGIILTYINLGIIESKTKNYKTALQFLDSSMTVAEKIKYKEGFRHIFLAKAETYSALGNYKSALENRKLYESWKDSVVNESHLKAVSELEIRYQTEKKEKNILALSQQNLKDHAVLSKQKTNIRRLSLGLLATILLFGGGIIIFRQRIRNQKQKELITAIADTQIAERKRIAQDLHDSVGGSLALAKNKLQVLFEKDGKQSKEIGESIETLSKTGEQVRQISHNLMPGELVKFGLVSAIQATLDQLQEIELKAQLYAHDMEKRIDPTKEIHLYRIVQEIIQNVLKHAKAKNLNVYLNKHKKHLSLMVEDDGVGMESKALSHLGIGLTSIKTRVAYLKGTMNIDSSIGQGTTLNIQIPV